MAFTHYRPRVQFQFQGPKKKGRGKKAMKQHRADLQKTSRSITPDGGAGKQDSYDTTSETSPTQEESDPTSPTEQRESRASSTSCTKSLAREASAASEQLSAATAVGTDSPPSSLTVAAHDLPIITNSADVTQDIVNLQAQATSNAQHPRPSTPPSPSNASPPHSSLSPRWQKVVTLFAGRRRSSASSTKSSTRPASEPLPLAAPTLLSRLPSLDSVSSAAVESVAPATKLLPHAAQRITRSMPPDLERQLYEVQMPDPRRQHPLTGNAAVAEDRFRPTVVQRGFDVPGTKAPVRPCRQDAVIDRRGDAWAQWYANSEEQRVMFRERVAAGV